MVVVVAVMAVVGVAVVGVDRPTSGLLYYTTVHTRKTQKGER